MGYLPSPAGQNTAAPAMITRRRLKAVFPILVVLLLIPFFFSAFHTGGKDERNLLSRTRWLYSKNSESVTDTQSSLKEPSDEENLPSLVDSNAAIHQHQHQHHADEDSADIPDDPDFEDLGYGPEDTDLDHGADADVNPTEPSYGPDYEDPPEGLRKGKGVSLLDLMDFPDDEEAVSTIPDRGDYRELFSLTTRDRRYIPVFIEGAGVHAPSLIPHPTKFDMWIILAQKLQRPEMYTTFEQISCTAGFLEGVLICSDPFENFTMPSTVQGNCEGDLAYINDFVGARAMRMFHGPQAPFVFYGSQSRHTCAGMWLQDGRTILEPFHLEKPLAKIFSQSTEVQRPPPWKGVESDFFLFWDSDGKTYVHHQLYPERIFAELDIDGSVKENLAPEAARKDQVCMAKYMPIVKANYESIEQAGNSLAVTLCERLNEKCKPSSSNTYVMHVFHQTFNYDGHMVYEPFLALFQQTAPFALHAISQRPFWIHGRSALTNETHSPQYEAYPEDIPAGHTERFSISSISWKNHVQKYHGYSDDKIMLGLSIEDGRAAIMDVKVSDLLQDLAYC